ncbi:MAG: HEAT repeat domain-containing protein [Myxococcota bacterium]
MIQLEREPFSQDDIEQLKIEAIAGDSGALFKLNQRVAYGAPRTNALIEVAIYGPHASRIRLLEQYRDHKGYLAAALANVGHEQAEVRKASVSLLAHHPSPDALEALVPVLRDPELNIRWEAMGRWGSKLSSKKALRHRADVRDACLEHLAEVDAEPMRPVRYGEQDVALIDHISTSAACLVMRYMPPQGHGPMLLRLWEQGPTHVRERIEHALARGGVDGSDIPRLHALAQQHGSNGRLHAGLRRALKALGAL